MKISKLVKNLLTFALAFAIVITVSVPCVWANASDASESTSEAKRAYDFLKAVGAMDTQETEFDTDKMITRAHFVKLALHLSNDAPNVLASGGEVFDDVTPSTDYEAYIETACRIGYISGSTQNLFEPEQTITLAQALKILCGILGYQQLAEINGGFPGGYIVMAQRLGLLPRGSHGRRLVYRPPCGPCCDFGAGSHPSADCCDYRTDSEKGKTFL